MDDGESTGERRLGGAQDAAPHIAQADRDSSPAPPLAIRRATVDSGQSSEPQGNYMSGCLMCGGDRATLLFQQTDRLYGTTDKQFGVVRCDQCGLIRLDPQPSPEELRHYYPENYWFAPDAS